jgi:hypothetical protein
MTLTLTTRTLVTASTENIIGLRVQHHVEQLLDLTSNQPVQTRLELGLVELYDITGPGTRSLQLGLYCLTTQNRSHKTDHAYPKTQNPNYAKNKRHLYLAR